MFKKALEYGMTPQQYWEEDEDLFMIYQEAYINKIHTKAHIEGLYIFDALTCVANNIMMGFSKKKEKPRTYPTEQIYNPLINAQQSTKGVGTNNLPIEQENIRENQLEKKKQREIEYRKALMQWI